MKRLKVYLILLLLLLVTTPVAQAGGGGGLWVQRAVIGTSGGRLNAGDYLMLSTSGQPVVGSDESHGLGVRSGFWFWYQHKIMVPLVLRN